MSVIKKPAEGTRSVINYTGEGTVAMSGEGDVTYLCGGCREPLLENMHAGQVQNVVIRCNKCGCYNETLD